ncbi:hypothetical protein DYH09_02240 [bacterium CPR1]|nr:hypothetical protein [bacterium CPR1]
MASDEIPPSNVNKILKVSERVCALCYQFERDLSVKRQGHVAHIDRKPPGEKRNHKVDNLCWLCLAHHDLYDSTPRLSKGLQPAELRAYRDKVHQMVREEKAPQPYSGPRAVLEMEVDVAELWPLVSDTGRRADPKLPEDERSDQCFYGFIVKVCNVGHAWTGIRDADLRFDKKSVGYMMAVSSEVSVEAMSQPTGLRALLRSSEKHCWRESTRGLTLNQEQGVGPGQMAIWPVGFKGPRSPVTLPSRQRNAKYRFRHQLERPWVLELVPVVGAPTAVEIPAFEVWYAPETRTHEPIETG